MKYLQGSEMKIAKRYFLKSAEITKNAFCFRSKCGSVIVYDNQIIGTGFNSPPQNQHYDHCHKDDLPKDFKSDKTCCIHAEQRAIIDALKNNPQKIKGSTIYFIRLDQNGQIQKAGKPYCTICSKLALDVGISKFILWHNKGICEYDTQEYNKLSFLIHFNP